MSQGDMIRANTVIAVVEETVEGTYKAPASGTDGYIQPKTDGFDTDPSRETKERAIFSGGFGKADPRASMKTGTGAIPVEMKGSSVEGVAPQGVDTLLESLLGGKTTIATQNTSKAVGNAQTVLEIEDADIGDYAVGDGVIVLESGDHQVQFIEVVDTTGGAANITVYPGNTAGAFSNSVVISKSTTFKGADTGHTTWSLSAFWGNLQREEYHGCRTAAMALEGFVVGELPTLSFTGDALGFERTASTASPFTPVFDGSLPPVVLNAQVFKKNAAGSAVCIDVNEVGMSIEQATAFLTSVCSVDGRIASRKTGKRNIPLTFNPYGDSTSVADFDDWNEGDAFKMMISVFNPSTVTGEIALGSCVAIWLPNCVFTKVKVGDQEGVVTDNIEAIATGGSDGSNLDVAVSFI